MLEGTLLLSCYLRAMGMKIGRRVVLGTGFSQVVDPDMREVVRELQKQAVEADVIRDEQGQAVRLEVALNEALDFEYEVRPQAYLRPAFSLSETGDDENSKYFRAEVHLREGGQDYDVMNWSREQVLSDMLDQYEKHLHFLHVVRE